MTEPPVELKPLEIGDILDTCFRLYRANFLKFILIAAIPQIFIFIANGAWRYFIFFFSTSDTGSTPFIFFPLVGAIPLFTIGWFLQLVATGALAWAISERYLGHGIEVKEAYRYVFKRIWPLIGALILSTLMIGAGFLLLIIPGILFTLWLTFITQAVVIENCSVIEAMSRSRNLARGNLGKIFVIALLYWIIAVVIAGILQAPVLILGIILGMLRDAQSGTLLAIGLQVMQIASQSISQILVNPIYMISFTLLYYDIRVRREGFDLQVMAENLGYKS